VRVTDVEGLGYRDETATIFDALEDILQADTFQAARQASFDLDEDPETLLLWIEENLPREYDDPADRAAGMQTLARADEFLGATQQTRYYRLWSYATDLMTGGAASAKENSYSGWTRYQFPSWLRKMGSSKKARQLREDFGTKVGETFHTGSDRAREDLIPALTFVASRHRPLAVRLAARMELTDDELELLLPDASSSEIDDILEDAEGWAQEQGQPQETEVTISVPDTGSEDTEPAREPAEEEPAEPEEGAEPDEEAADDEDDDAEQVGLGAF
jgi:replication factor C large subunit